MKPTNKKFISNFTIFEYDEVPSTMDIVKQHEPNTVIVAETQTAGRGKYNRKWSSKTGNLYFSMILEAKNKTKDYSQLSFLSAVAMGNALLSQDGSMNIQYKWPNDILLNQKKICGILLESDLSKNQVVIGIGVNIKTFPENVMFKASSVKNEGFENVTSSVTLEKFLVQFSNLYRLWMEKDFSVIREKWIKKAYNLGEKISVKLENEKFEGIFEDLDKDGTLLLHLEDGGVKRVKSGDVF